MMPIYTIPIAIAKKHSLTSSLLHFYVEPKAKLEAATALRDGLDHYTNGPNYSHFLKRVMPIFINILRGPCIFQSTSLEQVRYRLMIPITILAPMLIYYYRNFETAS